MASTLSWKLIVYEQDWLDLETASVKALRVRDVDTALKFLQEEWPACPELMCYRQAINLELHILYVCIHVHV
jgi:hypothetical protein